MQVKRMKVNKDSLEILPNVSSSILIAVIGLFFCFFGYFFRKDIGVLTLFLMAASVLWFVSIVICKKVVISLSLDWLSFRYFFSLIKIDESLLGREVCICIREYSFLDQNSLDVEYVIYLCVDRSSKVCLVRCLNKDEMNLYASTLCEKLRIELKD